MLNETVGRADVEKMVREFYETLIKALGSDLKNDKWYEHLRTLEKFWLMMMNGEAGYTGDPFGPHVFIGVYPEAFDRWLEVFKEHINKHYIPEISDKFYKKSEILADQFMQRLEIGKYEEQD